MNYFTYYYLNTKLFTVLFLFVSKSLYKLFLFLNSFILHFFLLDKSFCNLLSGCSINSLYIEKNGINITTPGFYESGYSSNLTICWKFRTENFSRFSLKVIKSDIEHTISCRNDYGIIFDGLFTNDTILKKWCGNQQNFIINTTSTNGLIIFKSNLNKITGKGFKISIIPENNELNEMWKTYLYISLGIIGGFCIVIVLAALICSQLRVNT